MVGVFRFVGVVVVAEVEVEVASKEGER